MQDYNEHKSLNKMLLSATCHVLSQSSNDSQASVFFVIEKTAVIEFVMSYALSREASWNPSQSFQQLATVFV
jgi:hypothetical protein